MKLDGVCPLPVKPGMTVAQAAAGCYQSEVGADTYIEQFEGWVDIEALEPGDLGRKIACCVEDGICVTVEMKYLDSPITDTFSVLISTGVVMRLSRRPLLDSQKRWKMRVLR